MSDQSIIHKTSAGGIVYAHGRVLALHITQHDEIVFPKGTIEPGETAEAAAIREILEETGYHVTIKAPLGEVSYEFSEGSARYRKVVYYYLMALIDEREIPSPGREKHETDKGMENLWLSVADAKKRLTHDSSKQKLAEALALLGAA